ncbi:MAG: 50S ribosomal protein L22 [Actinomycetota bacterium]|nr:50S ribosomal protein L22 [Actinomycetota bacterium]
MTRKIAPDSQEAIATARYIRISPTKARQVVDLIRGRHVDDARRVLRFNERAASTTVGKVLDSAVANAEHNRGLPADELVVARAWVDEGPTLRRFRPRAMGRATRIRKRTCHISVVVGRPEEIVEQLPEAPAAKQTARRVKKTTTGGPKTDAPATEASQATEASPETTSKKTTAKKTTAKKTTAKKTTAKKTTKRNSTEKKSEPKEEAE